MSKLFVISAIVVCAFVALGTSLQASTITWGTPLTCSAASDINTAGTLVEAINFGSATSYTVNGVNFVGNATGQNGTYSNFSVLSHPLTGAFAGDLGDAGYNAILDSFDYASNARQIHTLNGLTVGQTYAVQLFVNDARSGYAQGHPDYSYSLEYAVFGDGGIPESVSGHVNAPNNLTTTSPGSFVVGTFTADAVTQSLSDVFTVHYDDGHEEVRQARLSAYELRAIPEPSMLALLATGLFGLLAYAWRRRK
jgi:hypothetical protein